MTTQQLAQLASLLVQATPALVDLLATLDNSCAHTASDVAQDALDAWEHGNLTTEQCAVIVNTILRPTARPFSRQPQLPVSDLRMEQSVQQILTSLFN